MNKQEEVILSNDAFNFKIRTFQNRVGTWAEATTALINYLVDSDSDPDPLIKLANAKETSKILAIEITGETVTLFWIGVTQPLKDAITNTMIIDSGARNLILAVLNREE